MPKWDNDARAVSEETFTYEDIVVQGGKGELHLIAAGNQQAQPIVFMHGITEYARSFLPIMKMLPKDYYLVAIDLRGRGDSFKPDEGYRLCDYIDDLLTIWSLFSGHAKRPIVVGHSMSGRIATAFAAQYPQLLSALVLIDPPISGPGRRPFPLPSTRFTEPKMALEKGDMTVFSSYYVQTKMDVSLKEKELRACSLSAIEQTYLSFNQEPFHTYYQMITTQTLLLAAGCSPLISDEEYVELQLMNSHVQMKRIPNIGHEIYKEDPELFVKELMLFVQTLS